MLLKSKCQLIILIMKLFYLCCGTLKIRMRPFEKEWTRLNNTQFVTPLLLTLGHMHLTKWGISLPTSPQHPTQSADLADQIRDHLAIQDFRQQYSQRAIVSGPHHSQIPHTRDNLGQLSDRRDAIILSIQTLRGIAGISYAVNNLLASYEGNLYSELARGKQNVKKSGRYNTHDSVVAPPHLRWPNEGFHSSRVKKRVIYEELSVPQWVACQLSNIYSISDPIPTKQAVSQVIFAMRDTTSLPWLAVRTAWASSMHELEEGNLWWADATQ